MLRRQWAQCSTLPGHRFSYPGSQVKMAHRNPEKARYWTALFEEHRRSGQTIAAFCEERGLDSSRFHWWRRRLREEQATSVRPSDRREGFVELVGASDPAADRNSGITLQLDGGWSILLDRGFDPSTLKQVLAVVSERS